MDLIGFEHAGDMGRRAMLARTREQTGRTLAPGQFVCRAFTAKTAPDPSRGSEMDANGVYQEMRKVAGIGPELIIRNRGYLSQP
jgi:hypothetical protein